MNICLFFLTICLIINSIVLTGHKYLKTDKCALIQNLCAQLSCFFAIIAMIDYAIVVEEMSLCRNNCSPQPYCAFFSARHKIR